jgi:hypothetical protein
MSWAMKLEVDQKVDRKTFNCLVVRSCKPSLTYYPMLSSIIYDSYVLLSTYLNFEISTTFVEAVQLQALGY